MQAPIMIPLKHSIAHGCAHASRLRVGQRLVLLLFLLAGALLAPNGRAEAGAIGFRADLVEWDGVELAGLAARLAADGGFSLSVSELSVSGLDMEGRDLSIRCARLFAAGDGVCPGGDWSLGLEALLKEEKYAQLSGSVREIRLQTGSPLLATSLRLGELAASLRIVYEAGAVRASAQWQQQPIGALQRLVRLPAQLGWVSDGRFDARLSSASLGATPLELKYDFAVTGLGFDSPEGRFAGSGLKASAAGSVTLAETAQARVSGRLESGELLIDHFYRDFAGAALEFELRPNWQDSVIGVEGLRISDGGAFLLEGSAGADMAAPESALKIDVARLELQFPQVFDRYLEPMAAVWMLDGLGVTGRVEWAGSWAAGALRTGDLVVDGLNVVDVERERFAVSGLDADFDPGSDARESRLSWNGLLFGPINLGSGQAVIDADPGHIALARPLELQVMGGRLSLQQFALALPGNTGDGGSSSTVRLQAELDGLQMKLLTAALGWPAFEGEVSGSIPGVNYENGVLNLEGEVVMQVFDGRVVLGGLQVERPFGVLPSVAAELEFENLALEPLTSAFSFGQISGRLDGYVHDLRLLDWKPVSFDAWAGTPEQQQGSNEISRQAVNRLTAIGGGGVSAALSNPLLRMFSSFSYRRLGLGCRLSEYVCQLRGLEEEDGSVLILEGAGLPNISIRAYNRRIDWPQLVANLMAVSPEQGIRIGE